MVRCWHLSTYLYFSECAFDFNVIGKIRTFLVKQNSDKVALKVNFMLYTSFLQDMFTHSNKLETLQASTLPSSGMLSINNRELYPVYTPV